VFWFSWDDNAISYIWQNENAIADSQEKDNEKKCIILQSDQFDWRFSTQYYLVSIGPLRKTKVNFGDSVKNNYMVGGCADERSFAILAKGWKLIRFTMPLISFVQYMKRFLSGAV